MTQGPNTNNHLRMRNDVGHIQVGVQGATIVADPQMLEFWREAEHELLRDEPVECLESR